MMRSVRWKFVVFLCDRGRRSMVVGGPVVDWIGFVVPVSDLVRGFGWLEWLV